uniref:legumain n=1 Tax=Strigamia maritima TaxID=126957 RepID=T1JFN1_STRMM
MKMARKLVTLVLVLALAQSLIAFDLKRLNLPKEGKIWALLVAGSNTYENYRHQADICHSYHVLSSHGIPDEQIVVMMYDDIAQNRENPTKGIVINHPNGHDVYKGVLKDYTRNDVTPENFLNILQGKSEKMKSVGSGKVIKSGPNDHVFVFFADHGAPGLVGFPDGELYATDLNNAIKSMHAANKFNKLVLYIEACESGSMFENLLPKNINVFATTAANPSESSYACYFDNVRETYLGDVYSVNWMEDSDKETLTKETLNKQFKIVKEETNTSHVQEYGDLSIGNMKVSEFQGEKASLRNTYLPKVPLDAVLSHEVPVEILKRKLMKTNSFEEQRSLKRELTQMLRNRDYLQDKVKSIITKSTFTLQQVDTILNQRFELNDFECYNEVVRYFSKNCFSISANTYSMRHLYTFVNMCETGIGANKQIEAMDAVCIHPPIHGIV